ncbi:MAG: hypothetical protein NTV48_01645, partial [Candidatus Vogelbacteria bacterium]|nr:hypothetical protein [Candidatus Vogelbacteria bacterium]
MFNKNPQINQSAGVVSGKFTGDGALGGGLARSVASPAGYFKLEKQPVSNLPVSYQQRSLPAYVDKKSRSLVPVSAVLATLFAVSLIGVSPLIMSIISSSKVAFVSSV